MINVHEVLQDSANELESRSDSLFGITGRVKATFTNVETGEVEIIEKDNVFCTTGKVSIARRLANTESGYAKVTYCAVGTGVGSPAAGDVAMFTELFRKLISIASPSSNTVTFTTFYSTTEGNGVLTELGLFGDAATALSGSGTMYAHTTITKTKTISDTLTIEWTLTIS